MRFEKREKSSKTWVHLKLLRIRQPHGFWESLVIMIHKKRLLRQMRRMRKGLKMEKKSLSQVLLTKLRKMMMNVMTLISSMKNQLTIIIMLEWKEKSLQIWKAWRTKLNENQKLRMISLSRDFKSKTSCNSKLLQRRRLSNTQQCGVKTLFSMPQWESQLQSCRHLKRTK